MVVRTIIEKTLAERFKWHTTMSLGPQDKTIGAEVFENDETREELGKGPFFFCSRASRGPFFFLSLFFFRVRPSPALIR
jgi:hypothetical protein